MGAYLLGSIPTSYIASKWIAGIDLRQEGSNNLGATNVYRVLGWRYAVPVGLFDVAKGMGPVLAAQTRLPEAWMPVSLGVLAVVGHVFSVFMRFKGGKGVATAAGVVLGLAPTALAVSVGVWVLAITVSGYVSLASMLGAVTFPVWVMLFDRDVYTFWVGIAIASFIVFTHRVNVRRLINGTEHRFGRRGTQAERRA